MKRAVETTSGFTLLEVMIAMAILAIALTVLFSGQSRTVSIADISDFTATSALLGAMQMAELLQEDDPPLSSAGDFGPHYPGYTWQARVSKTVSSPESLPEHAAAALERIDVIITDTHRDTSFTISRYRFRGGE